MRRNESQYEASQMREEEKYQSRSILDPRTPSKQDMRAFHRQEGDEENSFRMYHPTPSKSTLGLKTFSTSKD